MYWHLLGIYFSQNFKSKLCTFNQKQRAILILNLLNLNFRTLSLISNLVILEPLKLLNELCSLSRKLS